MLWRISALLCGKFSILWKEFPLKCFQETVLLHPAVWSRVWPGSWREKTNWHPTPYSLSPFQSAKPLSHILLWKTGERNSRPAAGCLWWGDREGDWGARGARLRWIEIQKEFDAGAARWSDVGEDETEVHLATGKAAERSINSTQQCNCANNSATQVEMQRSAPDCNQLHYLRCWSRQYFFLHNSNKTQWSGRGLLSIEVRLMAKLVMATMMTMSSAANRVEVRLEGGRPPKQGFLL